MLPFATFTRLYLCASTLLVLPLLVNSAGAAPATDTHPPTKRLPTAVPKPKNLAVPTVVAPGKRVAATAAVAAPVAAVLPAAPAAPQTIQLKGIVLAPDGRPCAGASVYPAGAPRQLVVTDAQGAFTLPVPAGGPVSLRVEYFGEGSSRVEVPTPGAEPMRITLGQ